MPQATHIHTPQSVVVALQVAASSLPPVPLIGHVTLTYQDAILRDACQAARVAHAAMAALSASVADLMPSDPRHDAAGAAIAALRARWASEVEQASSVTAAGAAGVRDKAWMLDSLIYRDEDGHVSGTPALALAASLAADVLRLYGNPAA